MRNSAMPTVETADRHLSADLLLLDRDHLLVLKLGSIEQLLSESEGDPFASRVGSDRSGIDDAVLTLRAARRIPDELTVRVILPAGSTPSISTDQAQAALRRAAADQCGVGWREASAVRSMGRRQLPMGVTIALLAAVVCIRRGCHRAGYRLGARQGTVCHTGGTRHHRRLDGELGGCRSRHLRLARSRMGRQGL